MKNTYIISHNGKTYIGHNIALLSYTPQIFLGGRVTDYIAFGKGSGTPALNRYSLFDSLGAKPAEIIDINTDSDKGLYYIVRKITLGADEYVGETITELGFCAAADSDLITHCVLPQGVLKLNEPMDIIAVFKVPEQDGLLSGDNPLIKILLGARELDLAKFSCGYCRYNTIQDALDIQDRYPCELTNPNFFKIDCPIEDDAQDDLIVFFDDVPVIKVDSRYHKPQPQPRYYTVDQNGLIPLDELGAIKLLTLSINSLLGFGVIQAKIDAVSPDFYTIKLRDQDQKLFVSKDRSFLLVIQDNQIIVYQNTLGALVYLGTLNFGGRVSSVDMCMNRLIVLLNRADTPLGAAGEKRLRFFQIINGKISQKDFTNDLDTDAEAISLEYAGGDNMVLYYIADGVLTGMTFSYQNPTLSYNCSFDVNNAHFVKTSYRQDAVFATDFEPNLDSSIHKTLLDGGMKSSLSGPTLLYIKSISPDTMFYSGELIISSNSQTKQAVVYSYITREIRLIKLEDFTDNIDQVFLDGQYFFITDQDESYKILKTDALTAQAQEIASGVLPCQNIDQVFVMCDTLVIKSSDTIYYARILYEQGFIYSDQFAYGDEAAVRFSDLLNVKDAGFNGCAAVMSILI
ncbi:MAG TPA: hypothetical protein GX745_00675 [Clostridiales bacterium]|nr:hypothetical protein [Clostridiales bacterium]